MCLAPSNVVVVLSGILIRALGSTPIVGCLFALAADTIEYGEWKSGVGTEGLVVSAASLGSRLGQRFAAVLVGWLLGWTGYIGGAAMQTAGALTGIKAVFLWVPIPMMIIQLLLLWIYRLDKQYPEIVAELKQRRATQ